MTFNFKMLLPYYFWICFLIKSLKVQGIKIAIEIEHKFIFQKEAETHLPELEARDGIPIAMEDIGNSQVWNMRYR